MSGSVSGFISSLIPASDSAAVAKGISILSNPSAALTKGISNLANPIVSQLPSSLVQAVTQQLAGTQVTSQGAAAGLALGAVPQSSGSEMRATLSALHPADVYGKGGIMNLLNSTGGVIFPYTPTIAFAQSVQYTDLQLVHSNTDYPAYARTPSCTLTLSGKFTVQNQREGQYALAVIHFLRTVSKMHFGESDAEAGLPPPVLLFSAYGTYVFNQLRCVLKSHSWTFDENMDTVVVPVNGSSVRLPAMFNIQAELMVVQTPQRMRTKFNFDAFASGALMAGDGGYV